jgi:hypothetical protein
LTDFQMRSTKTLSRQAPLSVYADLDARADQQGGELAAGELRALVRIDDRECPEFRVRGAG